MNTNEEKPKKDKSVFGFILAVIIAIAFLIGNELTWIKDYDTETVKYIKLLIIAATSFLVGRFVFRLTQDD